MKPTLRIVIVNWNAGELLNDCLRSIFHCNKKAFVLEQVVLVDNDSREYPLDRTLLQTWPIRLIENNSNLGFAAACNQGACGADVNYLLFLNPDTMISRESINEVIIFMENDESSRIGICGIRLLDENSKTVSSAARFPTVRVLAGRIFGLHKAFPNSFPSHLMSVNELIDSGEVEQVIGAFFFIRRRLFEECEGFDERFFVYYEEVDLSLRAKKKGFISYYLSHATCFHKGGGCSELVKATRLYYSLRSRVLYAKKNLSLFDFTLIIVMTLVEFPIRLSQGFFHFSWQEISNTIIAYQKLALYFMKVEQ